MKLSLKKSISAALITTTSLIFTGCFDSKTADEHVISAEQNMEKPDLAILSLKNAIKLDSNNIKARELLGKAYLAIGQSLNAEKELNKAIELGGDLNTLIPALAETLMFHGDYEGVLNLTDKIEGEALEKTRLYQALSLSYVSQLTEKPFIIFQLLENENIEYQQIGKILKAIDERDHQTTKQLMLEIDVENALPEVIFLMGKLSLHYQEYEKAIQYFELYQEGRTSDFRSNLYLAKSSLGTSDLSRAESLVDKILSPLPNQPTANEIKAFVMYSKDNYEQTIFHVDKAIQNGLDNKANRLIAGLSNFMLEQYESAYVHFNKVKGKITSKHPAHRIIAITEMKVKKFDDATESLLALDSTAEDHNKVLVSLGEHFLKLGESDKARNLLEQASNTSNISSVDLSRIGLMKISVQDVTGIKDIENVVENEPDSIEYKVMLISGYIAQGQLEEALSATKDVISSTPESTIGYNLAGSLLVKLRREDEAGALFAKAKDINPNNILTIMYYALIAEKEGNLEEAYQHVASAVDINAEYIEGVVNLYRLAALIGKEIEAVEKIRLASIEYPNNRKLSLTYASILLDNDKAKESADYLLQLPDSDIEQESLLLILGESYLRQGQYEKARAAFLDVYKKFPENKIVFNRLMTLFDTLSQFEEALKYIDKVSAYQTSTDYLLITKGYFLTRLKRYDDAVVALNNVASSFHGLPQYKGIRAMAEIGLAKNIDHNIHKLNDIVLAYEENPSSFYALAISSLYVRNKETGSAITFLTKHVNNHEKSYSELMVLADLVSEKSPGKAIEYYKEALIGHPTHIVILNNLAWLSLQVNDLSNALTYSESAVARSPKSAAILDTYARVLFAKGDARKVISLYDAISEEFPLTNVQNIIYIKSLIKMNKLDAADKVIAEMNESDNEIEALKKEISDKRLKA